MKTIVEDFNRKELYEHYNSKENPFVSVITKIDITSAYNYSKKHKNLYATLCYVFASSMNRVPAFMYTCVDGKFIKYDKLNLSYTEVLDNGNVAFICLNLEDSLEKFIESNKKVKALFKERQESLMLNNPDEGEVWFSCTPWFKFTGITVPFDRTVDVPQIIWDKCEFVDDRVYVNAMIMAHHGFVDGSHIAALLNEINIELSKLDKE